MKRIISLMLVICLVLAVPALAAENVTQQKVPEYTPNGTLITAPFVKEYKNYFNPLNMDGFYISMSDEEFFQGINRIEVIDANEASQEEKNLYELEKFATNTEIEGDGITKTKVYLNDEGAKIIRWRYVHRTPDFDIKYEQTSDTEIYLTGNMAGAAVVEYLVKSMVGKYYTFYVYHQATIEVTSGEYYSFIPGEELSNQIAVNVDRPATAQFSWRPYKIEINDSRKAYFLVNGEKVSVVNNPESSYSEECYIDVYGSDPGYFTLIAYYRDENEKEIARSVSYCVSTGV